MLLQPSNYNLNKHNQLCVRVNTPSDFVVVFYKGSYCNLCHNMLPGFIQVSSMVQGCTFATTDLTDPQNMPLRRLALESTTPLNEVPQIILYFKDLPMSAYKFANQQNFVEDLKKWIIDVAKEVQFKVKNDDIVFSEEDKSACIGERCVLSIPSSKPVAKRYQKL